MYLDIAAREEGAAGTRQSLVHSDRFEKTLSPLIQKAQKKQKEERLKGIARVQAARRLEGKEREGV